MTLEAWEPRGIAVRAHSVPHENKPGGSRPPLPEARSMLLLDCETRTDPAQGLLFGSYRYYRLPADGEPRCVQEGLFVPDDLSIGERVIVERYVATHTAEVSEGADPQLYLLSLDEFVEEIVFKAAAKAGALIVGFNLPFDLSRLAWDCAPGKGAFQGGFSLSVFSHRDEDGARVESGFRPRVKIKTLDAKRQLMGFGSTRVGEDDDRPAGPVQLLDLHTLAFALTNRSHSLASACEAYEVEQAKTATETHGVLTPAYIRYNRDDVAATAGLYAKLSDEYRRHPIALPASQAYSPAGIGRSYLRAMGIAPVLERQPDFPVEWLGRSMVAYYGGRCEGHIRRTPVPVVYTDFLSMYPTVNSLMGLWELVIAERIDVVDVTDEIRELLETATAAGCFDPALWRRLVGLVELEPDGDILPVRAPYLDGSDSYQIGVNPLTADEPLWYATADALGSTLLSGVKAPKIRRAVRFVPVGVQDDLEPVELGGAVRVDPASEDFFRRVIEQRKRLKTRTDVSDQDRDRLDAFLKTLANATSYGIYAQFDRHDLPAKSTQRVTVSGLDDPFDADVSHPEAPGPFCFPPMAACITAAARLMLALLERVVCDAGGTYACCDTDSMAIVATEDGGLIACNGGPHQLPDGTPAIRAVSWTQVDEIVERFAALNPYDTTTIPGSVLKIEDENYDATGERRELWCYAISAKRYCLYTLSPDGPVIVKALEHGLGYLLNPTDPASENRDWITQLWTHHVRSALSLATVEPDWLDRVACTQLAITKPNVLDAFAALNDDKPYAEQLKPFNFMLCAHTKPFGHPVGTDAQTFQPIAPFERDSADWLNLPWIDKHTGERVALSPAGVVGGPGTARVQTYRDVVKRHATHPEPKALDPDGTPCRRDSHGLLTRRPVTATRVVHIGKEANDLDERQAGTAHAQADVLNTYSAPSRNPWPSIIRPAAQLLSPTLLAAHRATLSRSQIKALLRGDTATPRPAHVRELRCATAHLARDDRTARGLPSPKDHLDCCWLYSRSERAKRGDA